MDIRIGAIRVGAGAKRPMGFRIPLEVHDTEGREGEILEIKGVAKVRDGFTGKETVISHFDSANGLQDLPLMTLEGPPGVVIELPREKIWDIERARVGDTVGIYVMCVIRRVMPGEGCFYHELVHTRLTLRDRDWYGLIALLRQET